jgi:Aspartyl/Asparaginyl beta-hydroxylase
VEHFQLLTSGVDVAPVLEQIALHPELWDAHRIRKDAPGTPHSRMSDIWVRYNDVRPFEATGDYSHFNDMHMPVWYPAWRLVPALQPIVRNLAFAVQADMIGGVLITRIPPGEGIEPHRDAGWHVGYFDKFYLSLESGPRAVFGCDHDGKVEIINPNPGDLYRFDNRKTHWVKNDSLHDRMTLIICLHTNQFHVNPGDFL